MVENGNETASRGLYVDLDSAARDLLYPRLGSIQDDGGKGGNRTLDPGIMRDVAAVISVYIQIVMMAVSSGAGRQCTRRG